MVDKEMILPASVFHTVSLGWEFLQKRLSPLPSQILPEECERRATAPDGMHSLEKPHKEYTMLILALP